MDGRTNLHGDDRLLRSFWTWVGRPGWSEDPDLIQAKLVLASADTALPTRFRNRTMGAGSTRAGMLAFCGLMLSRPFVFRNPSLSTARRMFARVDRLLLAGHLSAGRFPPLGNCRNSFRGPANQGVL